jgi:hypothetical protein
VLCRQTDREKYFSTCRSARNLFLDPDTGIRLESRGKKPEKYVFASELVEWCRLRSSTLTLIFDQSYSRSVLKENLMKNKLQFFAGQNISGFAYDSHATFLILGADAELVQSARKVLLERSGLPEGRLFLNSQT